MKRLVAAAAILAATSLPSVSADPPIAILAAENFYGEVAAAIGGERVSVTTVLTNPALDPHDYEPSPSVARAVADARIVIFNGADYDHWMERLLESTDRPERTAIEAAGLIGVREGDNPHVWYDPALMPKVADALATTLAAADPAGAAEYAARYRAYVGALAPLDARVAAIRQRFAGAPITATEPVFGYMGAALGLADSNQDFQRAIMNETEPSARDIAAVEDDIRSRRVKALIYNTQVSDALTERLLSVAKAAGVPVVGVTETVPAGATYVDWMLGQLESLEKALAGPSS